MSNKQRPGGSKTFLEDEGAGAESLRKRTAAQRGMESLEIEQEQEDVLKEESEDHHKAHGHSRKILWVKKNLIDPTASLSYCLGVSIVHLAVSLAMIYVPNVSVDAARKIDYGGNKVQMSTCIAEAQYIHGIQIAITVTHAICFCSTFYREVFSAKTDMLGQLMRICEILCIPMYISCILAIIEAMCVIVIRLMTADEMNNAYLRGKNIPVKERDEIVGWRGDEKCLKKHYEQFGGDVMEWFIIEILVFAAFTSTMCLIMIKSRFMMVGTDNTTQFEPPYMRLLSKRIIEYINLDNIHNTTMTAAESELYYVNKERMISVQGVLIKIQLTKKDYQNLKSKVELNNEEADAWVKRVIVGNISKSDLDEERLAETNSMDMFQNSSIVYHTESILEMQIISLISVFVLYEFWKEQMQYGQRCQRMTGMGVTVEQFSVICIYLLIGEHMMAYLFDIYRKHEIKQRGSVNRFGVSQAPCETILKIFEVIVDLAIIIMFLVQFKDMTSEEFHDLSLLNYWIVVDLILMFFTLPYTYLSQMFMVTGEIIKNVYTLYQVQKGKLLKRRKAMNENPEKDWKNYFIEEAKEVKAEPVLTKEEKMALKKQPTIVIKGEDYIPKPKKVKKKPLTKSEEIALENKQAEEEDESSGSSSDSSEYSSSDEEDGGNDERHDILIKEQDFARNEKLTFTGDVYNYTICANMTKCCSPLQQGFALKQCFIVFAVQVLVPLFFLADTGASNYQEPTTDSNAIRLICSLLLHMIIYGEVKQALSILRYLKYTKTAKNGKRGRFVNILLCSMQIVSPFFTEVVLILAIGQVDKLAVIIKSFVALGFVVQIDNMFSENFPKEIKDMAKNLHLVISKDQNTLRKINKRLKRQISNPKTPVRAKEALFNVLINVWYTAVNNIYIIFYYYFFPLMCVVLQYSFFYYQNLNKKIKT